VGGWVGGWVGGREGSKYGQEKGDLKNLSIFLSLFFSLFTPCSPPSLHPSIPPSLPPSLGNIRSSNYSPDPSVVGRRGRLSSTSETSCRRGGREGRRGGIVNLMRAGRGGGGNREPQAGKQGEIGEEVWVEVPCLMTYKEHAWQGKEPADLVGASAKDFVFGDWGIPAGFGLEHILSAAWSYPSPSLVNQNSSRKESRRHRRGMARSCSPRGKKKRSGFLTPPTRLEGPFRMLSCSLRCLPPPSHFLFRRFLFSSCQCLPTRTFLSSCVGFWDEHRRFPPDIGFLFWFVVASSTQSFDRTPH
jgi:hypothetical protein